MDIDRSPTSGKPSNSPLVSVGVPVYNGENYLRAALASLLTQTYKNLEVIISDNASTDGTEEIGREFAAVDPRIRYYRQSTNLGAAGNYNFTLEQAEGELFMWNAHDDVRASGFVERAVEAFATHPGASAVFALSGSIDPGGNFRHVMRRPIDLVSKDVSRRLRAAIACRHPGLVIFGLIPRELLLETGRHGNYPGADRVLAVELALHGDLIELPEVMFFNRDHPERYVRIKQRSDTDARRSQESWWDPARAERIVFPAWRRFRDYLSAIADAPLSPRDRWRCFGALVVSCIDNGGAVPRAMFRDLLTALIVTGRRLTNPA